MPYYWSRLGCWNGRSGLIGQEKASFLHPKRGQWPSSRCGYQRCPRIGRWRVLLRNIKGWSRTSSSRFFSLLHYIFTIFFSCIHTTYHLTKQHWTLLPQHTILSYTKLSCPTQESSYHSHSSPLSFEAISFTITQFLRTTEPSRRKCLQLNPVTKPLATLAPSPCPARHPPRFPLHTQHLTAVLQLRLLSGAQASAAQPCLP